MAGSEVPKPHDHLFRTVFGEEGELEAVGLLQAYLPESISRELRWSSLKWQSVSFIDDRLRESESDLLYESNARPTARRRGCTCCWSTSRPRTPGCGCGC